MIYFLIPFLNEEQNLNVLVSNLTSVIPDYEKFYVFVDDGSSDNSVALLDSLLKNNKYKVLGDGKNYGPGHAFNAGFEWILQQSNNSNDRIVTIEADNTSDLGIVHKMVKISELGYDLVLASPYAQGGGLQKTPMHRKFLSFMANLVVRNLLNIHAQSLSNFYRVFNISILQSIKKKYSQILSERGFICMLEVLFKAIQLNASIIEVPMVLHSDARKGKSKMKIMQTSVQYIKFVLKNRF